MPVTAVGDLDIAYTIAGPKDGPAVLLLHGWPDDRSTWDCVAERLNAAGLRTIVPSLRGFGDTRFRSDHAPRTGDTGILAIDAIGLMDALEIGPFAVVGHDWGSNIAEALAVGWPERVERMAMLSTSPRLGGMPTPPFRQAQLDWYHWFMATARGEAAIREDRRGFTHLHWVNWAPAGWFAEDTFARVARAWDNPDWVDVTLHSYRSRWDVVGPDPRGAWLVERVKATETLALPVMIVQGEADGVSPPDTLETVRAKFVGPFEFVTLANVGHFPQREAPEALTTHLLPFLAQEGR
jgi:pimeloyl-ACP methyl ester carboxylesterase